MGIAKHELTKDAQDKIDELEMLNAHPDISELKKQENDWAIKTLRMVGRKKPPYEPVAEENKLYNLDYHPLRGITPNDLLEG